MERFRLGSGGMQVAAIQARLQTLGLYRGPVDGIFGGATESSVLQFQSSHGLPRSGAVDADTWALLLGTAFPRPAPSSQPLVARCLALTGMLETGLPLPEAFSAVRGNVDGRGLSLGILQWSLGQGRLQPLLAEMVARHPKLLAELFHEHVLRLTAVIEGGHAAMVDFLRAVQNPVTREVAEPWRGLFKALGRTDEFRSIQVRHAEALFEVAREFAGEFGLVSERGHAFVFDLLAQMGHPADILHARILSDLDELTTTGTFESQRRRILVVARRCAEASPPRWSDWLMARTRCIADGAGIVHGVAYDLARQFGIGPAPTDLDPGRARAA